MYICLDCYKTFEEPTYYTELHGLSSPPYKHWRGCPSCAGTYTKAIECPCCEKYITTDYIELLDGDCVCENCFNHKSIGDD